MSRIAHFINSRVATGQAAGFDKTCGLQKSKGFTSSAPGQQQVSTVGLNFWIIFCLVRESRRESELFNCQVETVLDTDC